MKPKLKLVSEEIVRWAFEVNVASEPLWEIAFTNPTAGPWKRVLGKNESGKSGEVHRFEIDEKRPDLILYSDKYETVIIVEAKTNLQGLAHLDQVHKTSALFNRLSALLQSKDANSYWSKRVNYKYELGLLWAKSNEKTEDISKVVKSYLELSDKSMSDILCIQGELVDENLIHNIFWGISMKENGLNDYKS